MPLSLIARPRSGISPTRTLYQESNRLCDKALPKTYLWLPFDFRSPSAAYLNPSAVFPHKACSSSLPPSWSWRPSACSWGLQIAKGSPWACGPCHSLVNSVGEDCQLSECSPGEGSQPSKGAPRRGLPFQEAPSSFRSPCQASSGCVPAGSCQDWELPFSLHSDASLVRLTEQQHHGNWARRNGGAKWCHRPAQPEPFNLLTRERCEAWR